MKDSNMDNPYVEFYLEEFIPSPISTKIGVHMSLSIRYYLRDGVLIDMEPKFTPVFEVPGASGPMDMFPVEDEKYGTQPINSGDLCQDEFYARRAMAATQAYGGSTDADVARADLWLMTIKTFAPKHVFIQHLMAWKSLLVLHR